MTDLPVPTARQVRAIRAWFGLTQPEFAERCTISTATLVCYERGKRRPTDATLELVARQVARMRVKFGTSGAIVLPE